MSSLISQIFSSIRIVQTFTMEGPIMSALEAGFLCRLETLGKTRAVARAVEQAGVFFAVFVTHSLAFWIIGIEVVKGADLGYAMTVSRRGEHKDVCLIDPTHPRESTVFLEHDQRVSDYLMSC